MRARLHRGLATFALAGLLAVTAGCGGDSAQQIARDMCNLMQDDPAAFDEDTLAQLEELETRAEDAGISDLEMAEAIQSECPEVFEGTDS